MQILILDKSSRLYCSVNLFEILKPDAKERETR